MRYLALREALELHRLIIDRSGGLFGIRDFGLLESALAQPLMTFGGDDLYPTIIEKAASLCFSVVKNHPFIDGNKRIGHALMETFLILNGWEIDASVSDQEELILNLAAGRLAREDLTEWLRGRAVERHSTD